MAKKEVFSLEGKFTKVFTEGLQDRLNWNLETDDVKEDAHENKDRHFFDEEGIFGELTYPSASKSKGKTEAPKQNQEVFFDDKTGKLIIQQHKIEKQTGLKRTIDAFEAERLDKMVEGTKVD